MEPESESALGILLHPFGRKGNAEKSSEDATHIVGGIAAVRQGASRVDLRAIAGRPRAIPQQHPRLHSSGKRKDLLRDLVGGIRGGRTRNDTSPYDDGTETPLSLLSGGPWVKKQAGSTDDQLIFNAGGALDLVHTSHTLSTLSLVNEPDS